MDQSEDAVGWDSAPDLDTQLRELFAAVQAAETNWRFDDRLDLAARMGSWLPRREGR